MLSITQVVVSISISNDLPLVVIVLWLVNRVRWWLSLLTRSLWTGHLERDEIFVPRTRTELGYPAFENGRENLEGTHVVPSRQDELAKAIGEAVGETPLVVLSHLIFYQVSQNA